MKFYNPYQFIPFKAADKDKLKPYEEIKKGATEFIRHDRWEPDSYSGRIICKLTTISPLVLGAKQEDMGDEKPKTVHPYRNGQALPANSLRGMIGSVVESISNSSMRVLSNKDTHTYSVRKGKKRQAVGNLYQSIGKIDKNLLPWNGNQGRDSLTPAEALFGVIEENIEEKARNLASRLRFYDATTENEITLDKPQILKILDSPKPPSPSMYFRTKEGEYIAKSNLNLNNENHVPNGRKRYLAHPDWQKNGQEKWGSKDQKNISQNLKCQPIPAETCFQFHIDFENLNKDELNLLRTAISPEKDFQHQLGLGKPLGLGQIKLKELSLSLIDRKARYSGKGLLAGRYKDQQLKDRESRYIDPDALKLLKQLGSLNSYEKDDKGHYLPVCYPFVGSEKYSEKLGYSWFVENDDSKTKTHQSLRKIIPNKQLPPLNSNKYDDVGPLLSMNQQILKIRGMPAKSQRDFNDQDLKKALQSQYPTLAVQTVNLGKGVVMVDIPTDELQEMFNQNEQIAFTINQHQMTMRQQK